MPAWQREDGPGNTICLHGKGRAAPGIQKDIRRGFVGAPGGRRGGQRDNRAARHIGWWGMAAGEPVGSTDGVADSVNLFL